MSRTLRDTGYPAGLSADGARRPKSPAWHDAGSPPADIFEFDADAWIALLDEQKLLIATAAGVDPSKVSIHVGH